MSELLKVKNLKAHYFTYRGVVKAVEDVSFDVKKGEVLGLVGETGCGKSTIGFAIMRLLSSPGRIVDGEILFKGEDLLKMSEKDIRKVRGNLISVIFQDPLTSLDPLFKIGDQVAEVIILHQGLKKKEAWDKVVKTLDEVRIPSASERSQDYPHQFSGGMRQRVVIATALSCQPELLIADEPTTSLDVTVQAQILDLIRELRREYGTAMLLITHNIGIIAQMCDRVCVMYAGVIAEIAETNTIFKQPKHPYTQGLLAAIPKISEEKSRLQEIPGTVPNLINPPEGCRFQTRCNRALDICSTKRPKLVEVGSSHFVACHLY